MKKYYFVEVDLTNMTIVDWGITTKATLTGNTSKPNIHKVFLTKGQYNKLVNKLSSRR
jgi:hypothetical protein